MSRQGKKNARRRFDAVRGRTIQFCPWSYPAIVTFNSASEAALAPSDSLARSHFFPLRQILAIVKKCY